MKKLVYAAAAIAITAALIGVGITSTTNLPIQMVKAAINCVESATSEACNGGDSVNGGGRTVLNGLDGSGTLTFSGNQASGSGSHGTCSGVTGECSLVGNGFSGNSLGPSNNGVNKHQ